MKKIVLAFSGEDLTRLKGDIDGKSIVICWNKSLISQVKFQFPAAEDIRYIGNASMSDADKGVRWMKSLGRAKFGSESLIDALKYKNISLWWWMEYWLYSSYVYYDSFMKILECFYLLLALVKSERPTHICCVDDGSIKPKILRLIAERMGISVRMHKALWRWARNTVLKSLQPRFVAAYLHMRHPLRKAAWRLIAKKHDRAFVNINDKRKRILFIYWGDKRDKVYLDPIFKALDFNKYKAMALDIPGVDFVNIPVLKEKAADKQVSHIVIEDYLTSEDKAELRRAMKHFCCVRDTLTESDKFKAMFTVEGIGLWPVFKEQFLGYFNLRLRDHLYNILAVDRLIEIEKPNVCFTPTETSEFDKGLFSSCMTRDIPVIAAQHGVMNDLRCMHEPGEVSNKKTEAGKCPIPAITAVYSKADREFLLSKGNYPKDSVVVTGNARYDQIIKRMKQFDRKTILDTYGLADKKYVLYITQPFPDTFDRISNFREVCKEVSLLKGISLLVKVHPNERADYYEKIAGNYSRLDFHIIDDGDIGSQIYICEIVITVYSTAGIESMLLGKPLIVINRTGMVLPLDYSASGAAGLAEEEGKLACLIQRILSEDDFRKRLLTKARLFLKDNFFGCDGKSTMRITNILGEATL